MRLIMVAVCIVGCVPLTEPAQHDAGTDLSFDATDEVDMGDRAEVIIVRGNKPKALPASLNTEALEAAMRTHMDAWLPAGPRVELRIERKSDGRVFRHVPGAWATGFAYISSSTAKPVAMAIILDQVARGNLALSSRPADVVPGWSGSQTTTLHDFLNFTSNASPSGCQASASDWATYTTCVSALQGEPDVMVYATANLDVAGIMAVEASGLNDWGELWDVWRTATGLFGGSEYHPSLLPAASDQLTITADDYAEFLRAVDECTILTPELCAAMTRDQLAADNGPTPALGWFGEDWHFGYGWWVECRAPTYNCGGKLNTVSTWGIAGQYAYITPDVYLVLSPPFDPYGGIGFVRSIEHIISEWAFDG